MRFGNAAREEADANLRVPFKMMACSIVAFTSMSAAMAAQEGGHGIGRDGRDHESTNPIPDRELRIQPIGQPIVVIVRPGQQLSITSATLVQESDGSPVALRPVLDSRNDPNGNITDIGTAVIMPDVPLLRDTGW